MNSFFFVLAKILNVFRLGALLNIYQIIRFSITSNQGIVLILFLYLHLYIIKVLFYGLFNLQSCQLDITHLISKLFLIIFDKSISMEPQRQQPVKSHKFKDLSEEEKQALILNAKKRNPEGVIIIIEAHPLCKIFKDLPEFKYIVSKKDNLREVDTKIKKKIGQVDKKLANQSVFLFTEKKLLNRDTHIEELYNKYKNFKDGVVYLYFANVEGF